MAVFQFVDSITASPVIRLDLNDGTLRVRSDGLDLTPPELRRATTSTLLTHGERIQAAAWANRAVTLPLQIVEATTDAGVAKLQALTRELVRDQNILRVQLDGQTAPVFFRTYAAPDYAWEMPRRLLEYGRATLAIPAEPFAYGLPEVLAPVMIANDAGDRFPENANPYFTTGLAPWTALGGTASQDTSVFYSEFASGKLIPDGVTATVELRAENVPAAFATFYRGTAQVQCAVSRNVNIGINWRDGGGSIVGTSTATFAVTAGQWTPVNIRAQTAVGAVTGQLFVSMGGTPPGSNVLNIDEARFRKDGNGAGGVWWDITGVKGDVETPPVIKFIGPFMTANRQILVGVRRSLTTTNPDDPPLTLESESFLGTGSDTSAQPGDAAMPSGFMRTTFATTSSLVDRYNTFYGGTATPALRGRYRVFLRYRKSVGSDAIKVRLNASGTEGPIVALPSNTDLRYVDLGVVSVPAYNDPVTDPSGVPVSITGPTIFVQAARDAGIGNLDMDRLVFIPAAGPPTSPGDDRLTVVTIPSLYTTGLERGVVDAFSEATYIMNAFGISNRAPMPAAGLFPVLNPGTNRVYFMTNAGTVGPPDSVYEVVRVEVTYWPRYLMVRTATT